MNWNDLLLRVRALVLRRRVEEELDEEMQFHIAMQARKNRQAGVSAPDAEREARRQFGAFQQLKEECRDARGIGWIESLIQDVRYALRGFRLAPGFAVTVVGTIALGLGLNIAVFTIFNAYVLRPLSVRDPYSLYQFTWLNRSGNAHAFTLDEFEDFRKQNSLFSEVEGHDRLFTRVEGHMMLGYLVTGNHFSMLGVNAALGRTLLPGDTETAGSSAVMVLSHAAWKNKFGGDPAILGKRVTIRGNSLEVVGVAREGYTGLSELPADYWAPLTLTSQLKGGAYAYQHAERIRIVGRLRHELTTHQAEAALTLWAQQQTADRPAAEKAVAATLDSEATAVSLQPEVVATFTPILLAFGLVLMIACANVANMMLGRAMARQREIGVRLAMGASRVRLIRQLLTESVLLALPAGVLGFVISQAVIELCQRLLLATMPRGFVEFIRFLSLQPDARVFAFMMAAAVISAVLFGLAPALQVTRPNVMGAARGEFAQDIRPSRLRNSLVIGQVAVSVLLLICASVLLRANRHITGVEIGLNPHGVIEMEVQDQLRSKTIQELSSQPLVRMLGSASKTPLMGLLARTAVSPQDRAEVMQAGYIYVSPEYFSVFRIPILRGRNFTADEARARDAVAVISQATAERLWPGRDALGQSLRIDQQAQPKNGLAQYVAGTPPYKVARVIGIALDVVNGYVGEGTDHTCIYFPVTPQTAGGALLVSIDGDVEVARRKLENSLTVAVPGAIEQIHSMDEIRASQLYPYSVVSSVSAATGLLALMMTLSGIYGVLSYMVTQRTKEIGIRVALGATAGRATRLMLGQSLKLAGIGAALGTMAAWGASRLLAAEVDMQMFSSVDGIAFVMGIMLVITASACAAWIPSRRAARVDPITALRHD